MEGDLQDYLDSYSPKQTLEKGTEDFIVASIELKMPGFSLPTDSQPNSIRPEEKKCEEAHRLDINLEEPPAMVTGFPESSKLGDFYTADWVNEGNDRMDATSSEPFAELYGSPEGEEQRTVDRKKSRTGPRIPKSEPKERNILSFWLGHFKKDYASKMRPGEAATSILMHAFLNDRSYVKPTNDKRDLLFKNAIFYANISMWFNLSGREELQRSKLQREEWKPKYFEYFETLLKDYGNKQNSLDSTGSNAA